MDMLVKVIIGLVRGFGGPDLRKLSDDLPGEVGEQVGTIIKNHITRKGQLSDAGIAEIEAYLRKQGKGASSVIGPLLRHSGSGDSLLPHYIRVLNSVLGVIQELNRPIVLRGFLHGSDFLSYWECDPGKAREIDSFKQKDDSTLVFCPYGLKIYVLKGEATEERLRELNLTIRKSDRHVLSFEDKRGADEVRFLKEFAVGFGGHEEAEIPGGAPAICEMIDSLPIATEEQGLPLKMLEDTLSKAFGA